MHNFIAKFFITIAFLLSFSASSAQCPSDFMELPGYGTYFFSTNEKMNYFEASAHCAKFNSHLVEINSAKESAGLIAIAELLLSAEGPEGGFWIGLTDIGRDGEYYWASSSLPLEENSFRSFGSNTPHGGPEKSVFVMKKGLSLKWEDVNYKEKFFPLCECNDYQ